MRIVSIGGGPAGLYFAILMKLQDRSHQIEVIERNRPYDTFGWGVVFSDETLEGFQGADSQTLDEIRRHFVYWRDIDIFQGDRHLRSTGHGFCGMSRKKLLNILQERAEGLGVKLTFETDVKSVAAYRDADLVLGADGVNSIVRTELAEHFKPTIDWRKCRFCWLGTDRVFEAFTFLFRENEHGLFQVHAYPFDRETSTFIVECREEVWKRAGLDQATEEETVAYCEKLFREELRGHRLLTNRSIWRSFPTIRNERWHHENVVLLGDAVHTAHFSIGSGTKLAMEDAIALAGAFAEHGCEDVPLALAAYEAARKDDAARLQKTAQTSLEWFENSARYLKFDPLTFSFSLLSRSKRITWDNLTLRDPAFTAQVADHFAAANPFKGTRVEAPAYARAVDAAAERERTGHLGELPAPATPPPVFQPYKLRGLTLANRVVVAPMCQYSAQDGLITDWHLVHLGSRGLGGAGLVIAEATAVSPEGRITTGCTGIWDDEQAQAWKRVADFIHGFSKARVGLQIGHAGRKASSALPWEGGKALGKAQGAWETIAPSPLPWDADSPAPREMTRQDMDRVRDAFVAATKRAHQAGFDLLELHCAHGYLLCSFLSALTNRRTDAYGGSLENRMRFPLEVLSAVREAWPEEKPLSVRISATEWKEGGLTDADRVTLAKALAAHGCDIVHVSAGGVVPDQQPVYGRMFQTPFSDQIRNEAGVPTIAVGAIRDLDQANTILAAGRADMIAMARPHLADPYLTLHEAERYEWEGQYWPPQYLAARPQRRKG